MKKGSWCWGPAWSWDFFCLFAPVAMGESVHHGPCYSGRLWSSLVLIACSWFQSQTQTGWVHGQLQKSSVMGVGWFWLVRRFKCWRGGGSVRCWDSLEDTCHEYGGGFSDFWSCGYGMWFLVLYEAVWCKQECFMKSVWSIISWVFLWNHNCFCCRLRLYFCVWYVSYFLHHLFYEKLLCVFTRILPLTLYVPFIL